MKRLLAVLAALLLSAVPVRAGGTSATISAEVIGDTVTYHVTVTNVRNPYDVWIGQRCYLAGELVDTQYQGATWTTVTVGKGNKSDASGSTGGFTTSGIHTGSTDVPGETIDVPWSSDHCEAWVWLWPDLTPIATTPLFAT
jgi:hypothetical protein